MSLKKPFGSEMAVGEGDGKTFDQRTHLRDFPRPVCMCVCVCVSVCIPVFFGVKFRGVSCGCLDSKRIHWWSKLRV